MNTTKWQGVYPAVTTKFKANLSLDLDAMGKHLEFQLAAGVHGVIILGSLGENSTLDMDEKLQLTKFFVKQINGRVPLLACIAESDTRQACFYASRAQALGVDGFMLLPPMRYPSDNRETKSYLEEVAAAGMNDRCGLLVNVSRSIIYADVTNKFEHAAREEASRLQKQMESILAAKKLV